MCFKNQKLKTINQKPSLIKYFLQYITGPGQWIFADLLFFKANLVKHSRQRSFSDISGEVGVDLVGTEFIIGSKNRVPVFGGVHFFKGCFDHRAKGFSE